MQANDESQDDLKKAPVLIEDAPQQQSEEIGGIP
jgi:hypothetical protein